ncbi:MAG: nickel pincer cofactor biosynthesis protein LarC [Clostridia bacterium]|nr:nickel pincer cofactor biosynthesis protein LarC [Clostridia bacterium]
MKILYLECGMGAAGDMLTAALSELLPDQDAFIEKLNQIAEALPGVRVAKESSVKCGITGTHISVTVDGTEEGEEMFSHHHHDHDHPHDHDHDHEHPHEHAHDHENPHDHEHDHDHDHPHEHEHDHDHDHPHEHEHHHDHEHDHEHHRDHDHPHTHTHSHSGLGDIEHLVRGHFGPLVSDRVKDDVMAVYSLIAEAESHAHGTPVTDIHFHEVGTLDAVMDITAVCLAMEELSPDEVVVSPIHVGSGSVRCAHGILPVPAPATAYILRDAPTYGGGVKGELCTPTGAALLRHFATRFGPMPLMRTEKIGYGMGKKDFEAANCVRAMLGEGGAGEGRDEAVLLACNLDDMTGEEIGFAMESLFDAGAFDVWTAPIGMKKSRPGVLLSVLCRPAEKEEFVRLLFRHTTTLGVRETVTARCTLTRRTETLPSGARVKISEGYGARREKLEYDDLARIAKEEGKSLAEVRRGLEQARREEKR